MFEKALLLMVISGAWCVHTDLPCGVCLCTLYDDGCVTADCSNRNISSLPVHVPNQTCVLILRNNELRSIPGGQFQKLINLTTLDLSCNRIDTIVDGGFDGISKLMNLNLSYSNLDFDFEKVSAGVFKPLVNLHYLELKGNAYSQYPDVHLSLLVSLESLTLDGLQNRSFGEGFLHLTNLESINLSGDTFKRCTLTALYMSTFDNVATIKTLNISHCNISYVEPGTFSPLQKIDTLDLSYNENLLFPGIRNVTKGLQSSKLRHLVINKIVPDDAVCVVIDNTLVEYLENMSCIDVLDANDNRIEKINIGALKSLKSVRYISVRNSRFTTGPYLKELDLLQNLTSLDLSGNHVLYKLFQHFLEPSFAHAHAHLTATENEKCCSHMTTLGNEISYFEVTPSSHAKSHAESRYAHRVSSVKGIRIPRMLKTLNYSYAELNYALSDIYLPENSLEYIDLSHNVLTSWPGPVFGVEKVTYLDISNNIAREVNLAFFENFKSLKFLNMSWNFLRTSIQSDKNGNLFRPLSKLQTLDVSNNVIFKLPYHLLEGLVSLQTLNISGNSIYSLELNYTSNTNLLFINASYNHIRFIPKLVRGKLDHLADANNLSLDISWNPFECTCDPKHLHFLDWLHTTNVRLENMKQYKCVVVVDDEPIADTPLYKKYPELKNSCKAYVVLTMILLSVVILITSFMFCGFIYRYRWRLIYLYYICKRKLNTKRKYNTLYDFDAFVSYADQDIDFVTTLMLSKLEIAERLNLYIRDRDSLPGATIAENIIDGIQRSKKSILLISEASLKKKWNTYELQMANMEAISTKRDVMIIVMLESVPNEDIPSEILYQVKNSPPLQYPADDQIDVEMFWASLIEAIRS